MTELRDYILSKLREMGEPTPPASQPSKKPRKLSTNQKLAQAEKQARDERNKRFRDAMGQISAGIGAPTGVRAGGWDRQNASTDLRTQLAYVLADKLEELKQSTVDSAAALRVAQVRSKNFRGEEKPVFKGGTGGTDKPEQIGTRSGAGKGVIGKRLSTLYKGKTSKGVAKKREDSSTNLKDRMVDILMETYRRSGYGSYRSRRKETPRERQDRLDYEYRDNYWSGRTDSQGNDAQNKIAPGGSDEGHKDSQEGHR